MSEHNIKNPIFWVDMEMTGLNVKTDKVLEFACLITDGELNIVAEGPNVVVHQPDYVLENMHPWCIEQHGKTGLTLESRESKISVEETEEKVLKFMEKYMPKGTTPLAGNTVYCDRKFIAEFMPKVDEYLHYRIIDVSSIKELCKLWYPKEKENAPPKLGNHRAMDDIKASVEELVFYRKHIFKPQTANS